MNEIKKRQLKNTPGLQRTENEMDNTEKCNCTSLQIISLSGKQVLRFWTHLYNGRNTIVCIKFFETRKCTKFCHQDMKDDLAETEYEVQKSPTVKPSSVESRTSVIKKVLGQGPNNVDEKEKAE